MRSMSTALRLATTASVVAISTVAFPTAASAAVCNWNTATGIWNNLINWSCSAVPTGSDVVVINTASGAVSLTGAIGQASTLTLGAGNALNVTGTDLLITGGSLTNNGTITFGAGSRFRASGTLNIGGTGTIILDSSGGFARVGEFGGNFVFGSGQTLRGQGELGFNSASFTNNGLMSADISGGTLVVDTAGGNSSTTFVNAAIMQATGGGILRFDGGGYDNSAGTIRAINNGTVVINNDARIIGGSLVNNTGGVLTTAGTSYLQNATVAAGSNLTMGANSDVIVNGVLTVNGTLTTGAATRLRTEGAGNVTLGGTGDILLDNSVSYARIGEFGGNFTIGSSLTVHGRGELGFNSANFTNNGLVSADVNGTTLLIDTAGGNGSTTFFNNNILQATNGATLQFAGGGYDNNAGVIRAINGGIVSIANDARIIGGSLTSNTGGVITTAIGNTAFLQNTTLTAGSNLSMGTNSDILINGVLTNNGTLTLNGNTRLRAENAGVVTINGTGNIVLGAGAGTYARIGEFGGTFIFGSNQSVSGSGEIGFNSALIANNNIFSFAAGSNVNIDAAGGSGGVAGGLGTGGNAGFLNNGTIVANNSMVHVLGGLYDNRTGILSAVNGGTIEINSDARIVGGVLSTGTGGTFSTVGNSFLQDTTLAAGSNFVMGTNSDVQVNGTLTTNGTFRLNGNTRLRAESAGAVLLNGTGDIVLDNSSPGTYARIGEFGGDFTVGSALTIHGRGEIGFNAASFTNNGLISADVFGTAISVDTAGGNGSTTFFNKSILQATNGGILSIGGGGYDNSAGIVRAINNGSVIIQSDARIIGGLFTTNTGGLITTAGGNSFLQNTTLGAASNFTMGANSDIQINGMLTVDGTFTTAANTRLRAENSGIVTINGSGNILLDNSGGYTRIGEFGGNFTFGSGLTVHGAGEIGFNSSLFTNKGFITADTGSGISIDAQGGSGGMGGAGVGTGGNAGLLNSGVISAVDGRTLTFGGGLYENDGTGLGGMLFAKDGGTVQFGSDANFFNLKAGGVLDGGRLYASGYAGNATINLRSTAANNLVTIGAAGNSTEVILEGAGSAINVLGFNTGTPLSIDQTLTGVSGAGVFALHDRNFTVSAGGGNFSNAGLTFVNNTVFTSTGFANSGQLISDGTSTVTAPIANSGTVHVATGTLGTQSITGTLGTILTDLGATLNLGGASTAKTLTNNGTLGLGTNNITVASDYTNSHFGSGNAFNNHAQVTGSGLILAANATMDLSGSAYSGGVLNVGNVRTGGSSSTTLTITNNGTLTNIIGAVQNANAPSIALTISDFALNAGGGSTNIGISYAGMTAGSLAGQTLKVVNNFDNVASQTIVLQGNVYQAAQAGAQPTTVALGARRVGDAASTSALTIANVAPVTPGFNETLTASASVGGGFQLNGAGSAMVSNLAAGSNASITLSHLTTVAGAFSSTVAIANTSNAVVGSGLQNLALAGQTVNVTNNVYALAVANTSGNTVNFGTVRQGATGPTANIGVTNGATGALTDSLVTSTSGLPSGVTGTAPGALAAGQSGNATFALNTATAGVVSGTGSLNFVSHDSELADVALASQSITFAGTVTELAKGTLFKSSGTGTFSGSGNLYTLNLGTLSANSGIFGDDIGVANSILNSAFSEALGGSFLSGASTGFSFTGNTFAGLAGGGTNTGNLLRFDTTGLTDGTYSHTITFNGYSSYAGLADQSLSPITLNISATVTGAGTGNPGGPGAVPEPSTWVMMLAGFAFVGGMMRRKAKVARIA